MFLVRKGLRDEVSWKEMGVSAALTHSYASLAIFGGAGLWYNPGASVCPLVRPQCRITITLAHRDSRNRPKTANTAYRQRDSPSARKQASQTNIREVSNVSLFTKNRHGAFSEGRVSRSRRVSSPSSWNFCNGNVKPVRVFTLLLYYL